MDFDVLIPNFESDLYYFVFLTPHKAIENALVRFLLHLLHVAIVANLLAFTLFDPFDKNTSLTADFSSPTGHQGAPVVNGAAKLATKIDRWLRSWDEICQIMNRTRLRTNSAYLKIYLTGICFLYLRVTHPSSWKIPNNRLVRCQEFKLFSIRLEIRNQHVEVHRIPSMEEKSATSSAKTGQPITYVPRYMVSR